MLLTSINRIINSCLDPDYQNFIPFQQTSVYLLYRREFVKWKSTHLELSPTKSNRRLGRIRSKVKKNSFNIHHLSLSLTLSSPLLFNFTYTIFNSQQCAFFGHEFFMLSTRAPHVAASRFMITVIRVFSFHPKSAANTPSINQVIIAHHTIHSIFRKQ